MFGSSSPLRGIATRHSRMGVGDRCHGPHRPYEGSQPVARDKPRPNSMAGPHRPYEGSQPGHAGMRPAVRGGVLIAPTRDRNLYGLPAPNGGAESSSPLRGIATGRVVRRRGLFRRPVLIAPTRDRNTMSTSHGPGSSRNVLIAPTRDRNVARGHGSHDLGCRSSSPLRGIATWAPNPRATPPPEPVLIAPTRDRNVMRSHRRAVRRPLVLIAPTRDRNRPTVRRTVDASESSSPLRGIATRQGWLCRSS
jgi:hypothetical protein